MLDHVDRLLGEQPPLGSPRLRWHGPMTREALARPEKAVRIDRRLAAGVVAERREGNAARLTHPPRLGSVRDDAKEPGLQRRARSEERRVGKEGRWRVAGN